MRCKNCNAKLDTFADSVATGELEKCPICGSEVSASDATEPDKSGAQTDTPVSVSPHEDGTAGGKGPLVNKSSETYKSEYELRPAEREPVDDVYEEKENRDTSSEEDVSDFRLEGEPEPGEQMAHARVADERQADSEAPEPGRDTEKERDETPSLFSVIFAIWLVFTGLAGLGGIAAAFLGEFILTGGFPLVLPEIYLTGTGLLLVFGGMAALSLPGALRAGRRILALSLAAAGVLAILFSIGQQGGFPAGEIVPGPAEVFALLAITISLLAVSGYGWALRAVAITALSLLVTGLVCGPFLGGFINATARADMVSAITDSGFAPFAPLAPLLVVAFGTALHFIRIWLDTEKNISKSFFTWLWPILLAGAISFSVFHIAYREGNEALQLFHNLSAISLIAGSVPLLLAGIAGAWQTGNTFQSDLRSAAGTSWAWAVGLGVLMPLLWLFAVDSGSGPGMIIVATCSALLFWTGWVSGKRSNENRRWLFRWEAAAFLSVAFLLIARWPSFGGPSASYGGYSALVLLPHVAWSISVTALVLVGLGKFAISCQYYKKELFENIAPVCRVGVAACLCTLAVSVAYVSGGRGLQEAISGVLGDAAGVVNESLLVAISAWPEQLVGGGAVTAFFFRFPGIPPSAVIALALTGAGIYWAADKKIRPAACLAGLLTLTVVLTAGFIAILFIPLIFLPDAVSFAPIRTSLWGSAEYGVPALWLIVSCGILTVTSVRFALLLPVFFKSYSGKERKERWNVSYDRLMTFGMVLWVTVLFLAGMVAFNWGDSAAFFHIRTSVAASLAFLPGFIQVFAGGWQGYGYALLISILIILAIHVESVRGEYGAFGGVTLIWTIAVLGFWYLLLEYARNLLTNVSFMPGRAELAVVLALLAALLTVKVLGAWALSSSSGIRLQEREEILAFRTSGVATLGRIGSALAISVTLACVVWLLLQQAGAERVAAGRDGLLALRSWASNLAGAVRGDGGTIGAMDFFWRFLWFAALIVPILFYIGQFFRRSTGKGAASVFSLSLLFAFIGLGMILGTGRIGAFSPVGAWLLGGYCVMLVAGLGTLAGGWADVLSEKK